MLILIGLCSLLATLGFVVTATCAMLFALFVDCDFILFARSLVALKNKVSWHGKTIWISGASGGIGEALAIKLASAGARLILSARREDELERVRVHCCAVGRTDHVVCRLDLADRASMLSKVESTVKELGCSIDVLVNTAGCSQRSLALDAKVDVLNAQLDVNVVGTISLTHAVASYLSEDGLIAVVASLGGKVGSSTYAANSASKNALTGYFSSLRPELAATHPGIDVTLLLPGPVDTDIYAHSIGTTLDSSPSGSAPKKKGQMTPKRCAHLMNVALAARSYEAWISPNPELMLAYLGQYFPLPYAHFARLFGMHAVKQFIADTKKQ